MRARITTLACLWLTGCVLQAGGYAGGANVGGGKLHLSHGGEVQSRLGGVGLDDVKFHLGFELDGRAEHNFGSAVFSGAQATATLWPHSEASMVIGFSYGMPAGWDTAVTGSYFGGTVELPYRMFGRRDHPAEINRNLRFLDAEGAIVPFVRLRRYALTVAGDRQDPTVELVGGVAFRTEIVSDLANLDALF